MPGNPSDVRRAPVNIIVVNVEYDLMGQGDMEQVSAGGVYHALGFTCRAGGVENEKRVLGVHFFRLTFFADTFHLLVIPAISAILHLAFVGVNLYHYHALDRRSVFQSLISDFLEGDMLSAAQRNIRGDEHFAV